MYLGQHTDVKSLIIASGFRIGVEYGTNPCETIRQHPQAAIWALTFRAPWIARFANAGQIIGISPCGADRRAHAHVFEIFNPTFHATIRAAILGAICASDATLPASLLGGIGVSPLWTGGNAMGAVGGMPDYFPILDWWALGHTFMEEYQVSLDCAFAAEGVCGVKPVLKCGAGIWADLGGRRIVPQEIS